MGNNNNNGPLFLPNNSSLQQQELLQLQLQEQQQEMLSLDYLNDQNQVNMQMEALNAQMAALNNNDALSVVDVTDVNVNMDFNIDQSGGGFDMTDSSSVFISDTSVQGF